MEWWIQKCAEDGGQMVIDTWQIETSSNVGTKPKENLRLEHGYIYPYGFQCICMVL